MGKYYLNLIIIILAIVSFVLTAFLGFHYFISQPKEKVYVAVEGEGKIVAFDPKTEKILAIIDLSAKYNDSGIFYAPHNVQVSPDMKMIWVTANARKRQDHSFRFIFLAGAHGNEEKAEEPDEVIVIDPQKDKIIKRIAIATGVHLAHVDLTPDNEFAYVTAQKEGAIYKINAKTFEIEKRILLAKESEPHGIRIASDGKTAYIAMLKGKSLGILELKADTFSEVLLGGAAVQTGVTSDTKIAMASLYDTKQLAIYHKETKQTKFVQLPSSAKGPMQMYPTPDSKFVYLADQGYYFNQPENNLVYKIDLEKLKVVKEIKAGYGPHGVAVSSDGLRVYVTNLLSNDVSIIDTATDKEISRIKIGKEPNGISVWVR